MKIYFSKKYILAVLFRVLLLSPIICFSQNSTGVISHIVEHTDASLIKLKDDVQNNNLHNETIGSWSHYEIVSDTSIRVHFIGSHPNCGGGHRAVLQENVDWIDIVLIAGSLDEEDEGEREREGYACRAIARSGSFLLHTQRPIGNRKITQLNSPPVELRKQPPSKQ